MATKIDNADALGRLIRERRTELGLTQGRVADVARVGLRFIGELESGKETVRLDLVLRVLNAIGIDLVARPR